MPMSGSYARPLEPKAVDESSGFGPSLVKPKRESRLRNAATVGLVVAAFLGMSSSAQANGTFSTSSADPAQLRSLGFEYGMASAYRSNLDRFWGQGLKTLVWLGGYSQTTCSFSWSDDKVRERIGEIKGHPGIYAYMIDDEPHAGPECPSTPEQVRERNALVKQLDPGKTTVISENRPASFAPLANASDVMALVIYPCTYNRETCEWDKIPERVAQAEQAGVKRYWGVTQTAGDEYYRRPTDIELKQIIDQWNGTHAEEDLAYTWDCCGDPLYGLSGAPELWSSWRAENTTPVRAAPDSTPPTVTAVSPSDAQTSVARNASVSVTFSEPMDAPSAQAAFSLARNSDGRRVPGTYSWSGNTLTFRPDSSLGQATDYTATESTGARDTAGNGLSSARSWSFKTIGKTSSSPKATAIDSGTLRRGSFAQVASDDGRYYEVNSTKRGTRTSSWSGRFYGVPKKLESLRLAYKGKASAACRQALSLWSWTDRRWVRLDSRSVGTRGIEVEKSAPGRPAQYVSGLGGAGEVRARVRCSRKTSAFFTRGDVMELTYGEP
jgi:hypothetical protein